MTSDRVLLLGPAATTMGFGMGVSPSTPSAMACCKRDNTERRRRAATHVTAGGDGVLQKAHVDATTRIHRCYRW